MLRREAFDNLDAEKDKFVEKRIKTLKRELGCKTCAR